MFLSVIKNKLRLSNCSNYTNLKRSKHFVLDFEHKMKY